MLVFLVLNTQQATIIAVVLFLLFYGKKIFQKAKNVGEKMNNDTKKNEDIRTNYSSSKQNVVTPDICPHCKNPISYVSNECEWCGSKII